MEQLALPILVGIVVHILSKLSDVGQKKFNERKAFRRREKEKKPIGFDTNRPGHNDKDDGDKPGQSPKSLPPRE